MIRFLLATVVLFAIGCNKVQVEPPAPPRVTVAFPAKRDVYDSSEFTGTAQASDSVELRARVQGYLTAADFGEGDVVAKDQLLFVIEQEPYKNKLKDTEISVKLAQATLDEKDANLRRASKLILTQDISQEEFDRRKAERAVAAANVESARVAVDQAQIELAYTEIRSPFEGRIGQRLVDPGNLVGVGTNTLLATIEKQKPIQVYFDIPQRTFEEVLPRLLEKEKQKKQAASRAEEEGSEIANEENEGPVVLLGLETEKDFPHKGFIDFLDNHIDPDTGTAKVRAVFKNTEGMIYPGAFTRLKVPAREPIKNAVLVDERAIGTDLGGKFVLVVGENNVVEQRFVELGPKDGSMRVILDGLSHKDRYITKGLQRARVGLPVSVEEDPTPRKTGDSSDEVNNTRPVDDPAHSESR